MVQVRVSGVDGGFWRWLVVVYKLFPRRLVWDHYALVTFRFKRLDNNSREARG